MTILLKQYIRLGLSSLTFPHPDELKKVQREHEMSKENRHPSTFTELDSFIQHTG